MLPRQETHRQRDEREKLRKREKKMHEKINLLETPGRSGISNASVLEILTFVAPPPGHRL